MNRHLAFKLLAIFLLMLLLLLPLMRIGGLVEERQALRDQVVEEIAASSARAQTLTGPLILVPYTRLDQVWKEDPKTKQRYAEDTRVEGQLYFLPEAFTFEGTAKTETRHRGIYEARLYTVDGKVSGHFELPAGYGVNATNYRFGAPVLALGISDVRGIRNAVPLKVNGQAARFEAGTTSSLLGTGLHAPLPAPRAPTVSVALPGGEEPLASPAPAPTRRIDFELQLVLQGTSAFDVVPVGRSTNVSLRSDWPHPGFGGDYLPIERTISATGFDARWQASFFSTNLPQLLADCVTNNACEQFNARRFSVSFVDPVDQYLKSDRAIKYALLFITLTFAAFFVFEVLQRLAIHPIQYGLVGLALALFFLLLLSLSEHIGFAPAYLASATASVALLGFYVSHVLQGRWRGAAFGAGLAALYGVLYLLLASEDYALLMGSLLLFGSLAAVMVATRGVDWSALGQRPPPPPPAPPGSRP